MKIIVTLTKAEVIEAVQAFLMDKGLDEGTRVNSITAVGFAPASQPSEYTFEVTS